MPRGLTSRIINCRILAYIFFFLIIVSVTAKSVHAETLTIVDSAGNLTAIWEGDYSVTSGQDTQMKNGLPSDYNNYALTAADRCVSYRAPNTNQYIPSTYRGDRLVIQAGDIISERLKQWASYHGYDVSWEADQYRAEGNLTLDKGLEGNLGALRESLLLENIKLNISIYENCVVRVREVK